MPLKDFRRDGGRTGEYDPILYQKIRFPDNQLHLFHKAFDI